MDNIVTKVEGNTLTITIDLDAPTTPSQSGKTDVLASTRGNKVIENTDVTLGLNLYRKRS